MKTSTERKDDESQFGYITRIFDQCGYELRPHKSATDPHWTCYFTVHPKEHSDIKLFTINVDCWDEWYDALRNWLYDKEEVYVPAWSYE